MKRIEAYLAPHRLAAVVHRLHELPRFPGLTLLNAQGQGHGRGAGGHYAYDEGRLMYLDRKVLVIICEDEEAQALAALIAGVAHTGNRGDGIVVVSEVSNVLHIRAVPAGSPQAAPPDAGSTDATSDAGSKRGALL